MESGNRASSPAGWSAGISTVGNRGLSVGGGSVGAAVGSDGASVGCATVGEAAGRVVCCGVGSIGTAVGATVGCAAGTDVGVAADPQATENASRIRLEQKAIFNTLTQNRDYRP